MSKPDKDQYASAIRDALREKRERKPIAMAEIDALEASLLADIEMFDLDAAVRQARQEQTLETSGSPTEIDLAFPEIVPVGLPVIPKPEKATASPVPEVLLPIEEGSLLGQLRQRAEVRQREEDSANAERLTGNKLLDKALKDVFFYLQNLVQQLNILKPGVPRAYSMTDGLQLDGLVWQEGFADYRAQSQSAGGFVESVSFTYQLLAPESLTIERPATSIERFRTTLFDFGLQFTCKEIKNQRHLVEKAVFQIRNQLSVSVRWKADFDRCLLVFETRNLERLGATVLNIKPTAVDYALLEELGKLVLGQPSRFRELSRR